MQNLCPLNHAAIFCFMISLRNSIRNWSNLPEDRADANSSKNPVTQGDGSFVLTELSIYGTLDEGVVYYAKNSEEKE